MQEKKLQSDYTSFESDLLVETNDCLTKKYIFNYLLSVGM